MYLFAPIAWPIAKLLDRVLGVNEAHAYKKAELKSFLQFHRTGEQPLRDDEIGILNGVNSGYLRIPIHEAHGLLAFRDLLTYDPAKALPVSHFKLSILPEAHPSINCSQALDYFQTGRAHLLLVSRTPGFAGGAIGVITLEGIVSEEIVDETDQYEDNRGKYHAKRLTNAAIMRGIVEREWSLNHVAPGEGTPPLISTPLPGDPPSFTPRMSPKPQQLQQQIHQHQLQYHAQPSVGRETALLHHTTPLRYGAVSASPPKR